MTRSESLHELEKMLESFLDKAASSIETLPAASEHLIRVDDIDRQKKNFALATANMGDWLAEHADLMRENAIPAADSERIKGMLAKISDEMQLAGPETNETRKIRTEIEKWQTKLIVESEKPVFPAGQKFVLKRGPESIEQVDKGSVDSFTRQMKSLLELWEGVSDRRPHVLSALDDLLKSAYLQNNQEALLLSGFIIYYLRQNGYLIEPYVKRLKAAESLIKQGNKSA